MRQQTNAANHTSQIIRTPRNKELPTKTGIERKDEKERGRGRGREGHGKAKISQSVSLNGNPTKKERICLERKLKEMFLNERIQIETDLKGAPSSGKFYTEPLLLSYFLAKLISSAD